MVQRRRSGQWAGARRRYRSTLAFGKCGNRLAQFATRDSISSVYPGAGLMLGAVTISRSESEDSRDSRCSRPYRSITVLTAAWQKKTFIERVCFEPARYYDDTVLEDNDGSA